MTIIYSRYIKCDELLKLIFSCKRIKLTHVPSKLYLWLTARDPVVINHIIKIDASLQKSSYDLDIELEHDMNTQMTTFLSRYL